MAKGGQFSWDLQLIQSGRIGLNQFHKEWVPVSQYKNP